MPTLESLYRQDPESLPFRQPVDPSLLGIPVCIFHHSRTPVRGFSTRWFIHDLLMCFMNFWANLYSNKCTYFPQDYFDIVKNPMDLSTIKRKLDTGQYQEPWQYVDDIWLMFNNAWLYNRKTSRVYKYCSKLAEVFEQEIDPVMQSLGYCCGRKVRSNMVSWVINRCLLFQLNSELSCNKNCLHFPTFTFFMLRDCQWLQTAHS